MSMPIPRCYQMLGLKQAATWEEVRRAYREEVKRWHPDRFPAGSREQARAAERMTQCNLAYESLETWWTAGRPQYFVQEEEPLPPRRESARPRRPQSRPRTKPVEEVRHERPETVAPESASQWLWQVMGLFERLLNLVVDSPEYGTASGRKKSCGRDP
jgi:hypothetical protein